jgi:hypothetical protein
MIVACYFFLNKLKEKQRVAHGKPAKLADRSMQQAYTSGDASEALGENAFLDMTDKENDEVSMQFSFSLSIRRQRIECIWLHFTVHLYLLRDGNGSREVQ